MARILDVRIDEVACRVERRFYCGNEEYGAVKLLVVFELDDHYRKLYDEYCRVSREVRDLWHKRIDLEQEIARKHCGRHVATYIDGRIGIEKRRWFRKEKIIVWDEELSPKLLELMKQQDEKEKQLREIKEKLGKYIIQKLRDHI